MNGQKVIKWLQDNEIARIILAEVYAIKCEQSNEEYENGDGGEIPSTYDELFLETLSEVKLMGVFK